MEALRWILLLVGLALIAWIYWRGREPGERGSSEGLLARARRGLARSAGTDMPESGSARTEPQLRDDDLAGVDFATERGPEAFDAAAGVDEPAREQPPPGPGAAAYPDAEPLASELSAARQEPAAAGHANAVEAGGAGKAQPSQQAEPSPNQAGAVESQVVVLYVVAPEGERLVGASLAEALERHGLRHGQFNIFHACDSEGSRVFSVANAVHPGTFDRTTMETLSTPGIAFFMQAPGPQAAVTALDRMLATARAVAEELGAQVLDDQHSTLTRQTEQHLRESLRLIDSHMDRART